MYYLVSLLINTECLWPPSHSHIATGCITAGGFPQRSHKTECKVSDFSRFGQMICRFFITFALQTGSLHLTSLPTINNEQRIFQSGGNRAGSNDSRPGCKCQSNNRASRQTGSRGCRPCCFPRIVRYRLHLRRPVPFQAASRQRRASVTNHNRRHLRAAADHYSRLPPAPWQRAIQLRRSNM